MINRLQIIASYPFPLRVIIFLLILLAIWLPLAAPIYLLVKDSNLATILTMGLLFTEFLFLVPRWGKQVYGQTQLLKSYGLINTRKNGFELLIGLAIGLLLTFSLFAVQGLFGLVAWQNSDNLPRIIAEGLLSALGVGFAEELVFRGWVGCWTSCSGITIIKYLCGRIAWCLPYLILSNLSRPCCGVGRSFRGCCCWV